MINYNQLKKIILKNNIKPVSHREMPLYSASCIYLGYTKYLRRIVSFSYQVVAAFGGKDCFTSFFNEDHISEQTKKMIDANYKNINQLVLIPAKKILNESEKKLQVLKNKKITPEEALKIINDFYPRYMSSIGVYNCFWRYLGNNFSKGKLTKKDVQQISKERELVAKFYPKIEELIKEYSIKIGKKGGFDGDLLGYFTCSEMEKYLSGKIGIKKMLPILSARRQGYFFLYQERNNQEKVITDKAIIQKIKKDFLVAEEVRKINGFPAFKGKARGLVYNLQNHKLEEKNKLPQKFILVTSMTHPDNIALVKKCQAIITDEGGILCHAAIISRELKKPCIIGTKIATKVLKDGDLVEVDANKGIVKIIKKNGKN